jgi:hypothetical protein
LRCVRVSPLPSKTLRNGSGAEVLSAWPITNMSFGPLSSSSLPESFQSVCCQLPSVMLFK